VVNYALERRRGIGKAKGHDLILVISMASSKGSFVFVAFLDTDVVKPYREIERGILLRFSDPFSYFRNKWERVAILDRIVVEGSIVDNYT